MYVHRPHPIEGDPLDAILFDNCERCEQLADDMGINLSRHVWREAWKRMLDVEFGTERTYYSSSNEGKLCGQLYTIAVALDRYFFYYDRVSDLLDGNFGPHGPHAKEY